MTQIATVEKLLPGGYAEISVPRKYADARPGDKVVVESSTKKLLGVVALVYLLPVVGFLLGYFLTEGLMTENWRYVTALAAAALFFLPSVFYDRHARKNESLTYTILRLF